uniref:TRAF3-interacting protein 1 n=1 Tax=Catagonus wagneri TaxID=51154 RepID=A0A8C3X508_9CETA
MNAAVVKRTQEALGKVIRRPPLTEKLLNKPPFRYLHDIITEVIRMTGFMKGLYTDAEMKSDNVKDKDAKISFLQKAIDVVVLISGEPLSAKPARIVAGQEPENTNELLQRIGKCCLNKLSSEDAVRRVLAGEKGRVKSRPSLTPKPQETDNKNAREEEPRAPKGKEDRRNSEINERSTSRDRKQKEELREESKPREKEKAKESDRDRHKDPERDKNHAGDREQAGNRARPERDRDPARDRDRENQGGKERERRKDRERARERDRDPDKDRDRERDKERDRRRVRDGEHSRDPGREKSREPEKPEKKTEISTGASRSVTTKASKRRSKNSVEGDSPSDAEGEAGPCSQDKREVLENSQPPSELPATVRRTPRPGSARPAPPRVRRQESAEALPTDRAGSGRTVSHVITDSQDSDNDGDDQFVVEAAPQLSEVSELELVQAVEIEEDEKHGGLVKKILETKKDYEKLQQSPKPGEKEKSLVFESAWKKEKDIVSKEIEKLRASIQTLCRSALPLGRVVDYIQEDVDAMHSELQLWHSENRQHAEALQKEQSITDCAVEPLKAELAELEQLVRDQQDKICAVKANILKNEEKIQKMVYSINLSSRR